MQLQVEKVINCCKLVCECFSCFSLRRLLLRHFINRQTFIEINCTSLNRFLHFFSLKQKIKWCQRILFSQKINYFNSLLQQGILSTHFCCFGLSLYYRQINGSFDTFIRIFSQFYIQSGFVQISLCKLDLANNQLNMS